MSSPPYPYLSSIQRRSYELCRAAAIFTHRQHEVDGGTLDVFHAGPPEAPSVVLMNPLGVSSLFFAPMVRRLAERFRVVTWEYRLDSSPLTHLETAGFAPKRHLDDTRIALGTAASSVAAVVAYCSGCYGALYSLLERQLEAPRLLCLVSPPLEVGGLNASSKTMYQNTFVPLLERIAVAGPRMAGLVRAIMAKAEKRTATGVDAELAMLNEIPFTADESTYRYAKLHHQWRSLDWDRLVPQVSTQTVILHGTEDDIVHERTVEALAAHLPRARLELYPGAGHFAISQSEALIGDAVKLVTRTCQ